MKTLKEKVAELVSENSEDKVLEALNDVSKNDHYQKQLPSSDYALYAASWPYTPVQ